jgi:hypothetical protein
MDGWMDGWNGWMEWTGSDVVTKSAGLHHHSEENKAQSYLMFTLPRHLMARKNDLRRTPHGVRLKL